MRIGIVGAGGAGLAAAWLLSDEHDVTLFERQDRLGGHAHTLEVEQGGEQVGIDAGFEFFSGAMFPTFARLLELLGVPQHRFLLTATLYTVDRRHLWLLPPVRNGRVIWPAVKPRQIADLLRFGYVLHRARGLMQAHDTSRTLEQFLDELPLTRSFKQDFMYPFLLAGWCVEPDDYRHFIAYDVLRYSFMHRPAGLSPRFWTEIVGGSQTYIQALAHAVPRAAVKTSSPIDLIRRHGSTLVLQTESGGTSEFDQVVLATNAHEAGRLLTGLEGLETVRQALGLVEYFKTTIAVHGDLRLMPAQRRHWSVANLRHDGRYCATTIWKGWKSRAPIFKSWVTYEARLPEPLYGVATFDHPKVNASYFQAQKRLAPCQGQQQVWLAGMHTTDVDCHESAIMSAVNVARRLAPRSARLRQLLDTHPSETT